MATQILVDVTRAYPFKAVATTLDAVWEFCGAVAESATRVVLCRRDQQAECEQAGRDADVVVTGAYPPMNKAWDAAPTLSAVREHTAQALTEDPSTVFMVFSYSREVLMLPMSEAHLRDRYQAMTLAGFDGVGATVRDSLTGWRWESVISEREALDVMRRAVERHGTLHITLVKPAMAQIDRRFAGKGILTGTQGMIGYLANAGADAGMWSLQGHPSSQYLTGRPVTFSPRDSSTHGPPAVPAPGAVIPAPSAEPELPDRMRSFLRDGNLGPFSRERVTAVDALDEIVGDGGKRLVDVIDEAVSVGCSDRLNQVPPFRRFLIRLLDSTEVLLQTKDGPPLRVNAGTLMAPVGAIAEDWKLRCDAALLLPLLLEFRPNERDMDDILWVLYADRGIGTGRSHARLAEVVDHLSTSGAISIDEDGRIAVPQHDVAESPTEGEPADSSIAQDS